MPNSRRLYAPVWYLLIKNMKMKAPYLYLVTVCFLTRLLAKKNLPELFFFLLFLCYMRLRTNGRENEQKTKGVTKLFCFFNTTTLNGKVSMVLCAGQKCKILSKST